VPVVGGLWLPVSIFSCLGEHHRERSSRAAGARSSGSTRFHRPAAQALHQSDGPIRSIRRRPLQRANCDLGLVAQGARAPASRRAGRGCTCADSCSVAASDDENPCGAKR
jgi:hypothetical protein